jgi:endogenous inhibitor of DNA gyrase (YacG/DUF329 family)
MGQISKETGIPASTIKSYFRRHQPARGDKEETHASPSFCAECGKPLKRGGRGKSKRFCKEFCRRAWWKAHKNLVNSDSLQIKCASCGKDFVSYKSRKQKYCSHGCYIKARFGKEGANE